MEFWNGFCYGGVSVVLVGFGAAVMRSAWLSAVEQEARRRMLQRDMERGVAWGAWSQGMESQGEGRAGSSPRWRRDSYQDPGDEERGNVGSVSLDRTLPGMG